MTTYYERNKERQKALAKKYRDSHLEKCRAYAAAYFQQVTKPQRRLIAMQRPKPEPKPAPPYTIKTTIKYREPVPKAPKVPKVKPLPPSRPVAERSGTLTFD